MSGLLDDLTRYARSIGPVWLARLRTAATLGVLALLVVVAVRVGLDRVAEPFPESADPAICTPTPVAAGDPVLPGAVTVSVINAGGANGLAGRTLSELVDLGFGRGELGDAPEGTRRVATSQIWTTEGTTAAVKLVRSYLKGKVTIVERDGPVGGLNVVVGEGFKDVKKGRAQFRAESDETTCIPTAPVETPAPSAPPAAG